MSLEWHEVKDFLFPYLSELFLQNENYLIEYTFTGESISLELAWPTEGVTVIFFYYEVLKSTS